MKFSSKFIIAWLILYILASFNYGWPLGEIGVIVILVSFLLSLWRWRRPLRLISLLAIGAVTMYTVVLALPIYSIGWRSIRQVEVSDLNDSYVIDDPIQLRELERIAARGSWIHPKITTFNRRLIITDESGDHVAYANTSGYGFGTRQGNAFQAVYLVDSDELRTWLEGTSATTRSATSRPATTQLNP